MEVIVQFREHTSEKADTPLTAKCLHFLCHESFERYVVHCNCVRNESDGGGRWMMYIITVGVTVWCTHLCSWFALNKVYNYVITEEPTYLTHWHNIYSNKDRTLYSIFAEKGTIKNLLSTAFHKVSKLSLDPPTHEIQSVADLLPSQITRGEVLPRTTEIQAQRG